MEPSYLVLDIETAPLLPFEDYEQLDQEHKQKLMNPHDSRVVAVGLRFEGNDHLLSGDREKDILQRFWHQLRELFQKDRFLFLVGFNISDFDFPFLITRSCIHNVAIVPFSPKNIIDLRDKINAYRYGRSRGTLKEFANHLGIPLHSITGDDIASLAAKKDFAAIESYLLKDLEITDALLKRVKETGIIHLTRY